MDRAVGLIELKSIARGILVADTMVKAARVTLITARPICPGKYLVLVGGEVGAVESAVAAGIVAAAESLVQSFVIPNLHPQVFPALSGATEVGLRDALGIIETFSVVTSIVAADAAVKAAAVDLIEVRVAVGLGGKAFFTLTGEVASVEAAVQAGANRAREDGDLVETIVIPAPDKDLMQAITFG